jgi:hypothetical protein
MHDDNPDHVLFQAGIETHRLAQEIGHAAGSFDAGESATCHDHRQRLVAFGFDRLIVRQLQRINHAIAKENGISQRLHCQRMCLETRRVIKVRYGSERQHELIIVHLVCGRQILVADAHLFLDEINRLDIGDPHPGTMEHLAKRLDDVGNGHIAPRYFVQHRRKENKIFFGDQRDLYVRRAGQPLLQVHRGERAGEAAAENQDASLAGGLGARTRLDRCYWIHSSVHALRINIAVSIAQGCIA